MTNQPEERNQFFNFPEEPLGFAAEDGLGYYQGGPGSKLGPQGRYEIKKKIGYGTASSVWLAKDHITDRFLTLKILSGYTTRMNMEHKLQELDIYRSLGSEASKHNCSTMLDHTFQPGIENDDGQHLCFVLELFQCTIQDAEKNLDSGSTFPLFIIKRIVKDVLSAMAFLHQHGIAHTDIKPDNIMIAIDSTFNVECWLEKHPPKTYDSVPSLKGTVVSHVSHQLPPPHIDELSNRSFILSDLSNSQFVSRQTTDDITPLGLRPPEILLGGEWNQSVDIWTLGNLLELFWPKELRPLEMQKAFEANKALPDSIDFLLYQMVIFGAEHFPGAMLRACQNSSRYFENSCKLKMFNKFVPRPFIECLNASLVPLTQKEKEGAASFMNRCLQLESFKRASATELLLDPWLLS